MQNVEYPTVFIDSRGTEHVTMVDDGEYLNVTIRGVEFSGRSWGLLDAKRSDFGERFEEFDLRCWNSDISEPTYGPTNCKYKSKIKIDIVI